MPETSTVALPAGFEDLARFTPWALRTEAERIEARLSTPYQESMEFYRGMVGEMERIMSYLLTVPVGAATAEDETLMYMTFSLCEVANAVEIYGESEIPDGANLRLFTSVLEKPGA
ncbi:MAG: hypothetical protein JWQ26_688 [Modestobacter sp.]|jgi:hypothetical protein|nr:hypothetical protein [Modestobacter sp.]HEV7726496.1 hypothetical protein [Modestobacter sp.]